MFHEFLVKTQVHKNKNIVFIFKIHIIKEPYSFRFRLLHLHITDYGVLWSTAVKKMGQFLEFQQYLDLFGRDGAQRLFRRHVKKLKDDYLNSKVQRYFDVLPEVLHQLFPDFETFTEE